MESGSKDEMKYLSDISRIANALERIAHFLQYGEHMQCSRYPDAEHDDRPKVLEDR